MTVHVLFIVLFKDSTILRLGRCAHAFMAVKSLYQLEEKPYSKQEIILDDNEKRSELKKTMKVSWNPDEDASKTLAILSQRHTIMDDARPHDDWELRLLQYNSDLIIREDGLANVNLAIEKACVRNKLADIQAQKTVVDFLPQEKEDIYKREMYGILLDFVRMEGNFDREQTKFWYNVLVYGSAPWFEGLKKQIRTQYIPEIMEDGRVVGKAKITEQSWLYGFAPDPRSVWIDPVPDIEDAADCFIEEKDLSYDDIENLKNDPNFDADAVDMMLTQTSMNYQDTNSQATFTTREENKAGDNPKYSLMHYYNCQKGMYIVTDHQFRYILREGVNPYPHGELPISIMVDHPRMQELYGDGECKLLENTKYERNTIRNQMLDSARASNMRNLAIGEGLTFMNNEQVQGVGMIWNFAGDLDRNMKDISQAPQDSSLANMDSLLQNDATWLTGVDNNSLAGSPEKTAFQARLQETTKMKGIGVLLRSYDYFLTRVTRQTLANIQAFLPSTTGRKIIGEDKIGKNRMIAINDKEVSDVLNSKRKVVGKSFKDAKGKTAFLELSPELIRSNMDVVVKTQATTPVLRELDRQDMDDIVKTWMEIAQTPQGAKMLDNIDFEAFNRDMMIRKGFQPDKYSKNASGEQNKGELMQKVLGDVPAPPRPFGQPENQSPQQIGLQNTQGAMMNQQSQMNQQVQQAQSSIPQGA